MFGRGDRGEQPVSNGHGGGGHVAEGTPIPLSTSSHESLFHLLMYGYIWFYFTGNWKSISQRQSLSNDVFSVLCWWLQVVPLSCGGGVIITPQLCR
jgi:hypothetical protein